MDFSKADLQTFYSLGLSILQAKVYLTLIRLPKATIKEIASSSGVARQDIYRITNELLKKGLVKKELTIPTQYEAVSLVDGTNNLQKEIDKKAVETRKETCKLLKRYEHKPKVSNNVKKEFSLSIVPKKDALQFSITQIKGVKKSIDLLTSYSKARFMMWTAKEFIKEALLRKVRFRIIFEKPKDQKQLLPKLKYLTTNPLFNIKLVNFTPSTALAIYDNKQISLMLKPKETLSKTTLLTSNNSAILEIISDYFEIKWLSAIESKN